MKKKNFFLNFKKLISLKTMRLVPILLRLKK